MTESSDFERELRENGTVVFTVTGDSMMPLLRQHKDIVVIRAITRPLRKYDTVLFRRPNGVYVLHRIVKVCGGETYQIVGDNRDYPETVPQAWILGVLSEVIKDGQHISVESRVYKQYLQKVKRRRFCFWFKRYVEAVKRILKR